MQNNSISHRGIISNVLQDKIIVKIISESACSSCKSQKMCSISEMKEKEIYITKPFFNVNIGENVNVVMTESQGVFAVLLAYIIPFIIMMTELIILYYSHAHDLIIGIVILISLVIYFFILFKFKNKLNKKFSFKIEKL